MPVKVNANADANRGNVFMVTSGGSGYPTTGGESNGNVFYTKLRGDGSGGIARLVVSGGAIVEFGNNDNSGNSYMQTNGTGYLASFDLSSGNIYTDASASTLISGTPKTDWEGATAGTIVPILTHLVDMQDAIAELGGHYVMLHQN